MLKSPRVQPVRESLRRALMLLLVALFPPQATFPLAAHTTHTAPQAIRAVAERVNNYCMANRPGDEDNEWARAVYFMGNMAHHQLSGDAQSADQAWGWAESFANWQ